MFKIHDALFIKYGVRPLYLRHAVAHYKVEDDEEVLETKKKHEGDAKRAIEAIEKDQELADDEVELVDEELKRLLAKSGPVMPDDSGNIPLERYVEIHVAVLSVIHEIATKKRGNYRQRRLEFMMSNRMELYRKLVRAHLTEG